MNDLFAQSKSKKELLKEFILGRKWTKTHDVQAWGLKNFHTRALRDAQELAHEGFFRRMTQQEHDYFFGVACKEDAWVKNDFKVFENREAA